MISTFNNHSEIIRELLAGNILIFNNQILFRIHNRQFQFHEMVELDTIKWLPCDLVNFNLEHWEYFDLDEYEVKRSKIGKWCYVWQDPEEQENPGTIVKILIVKPSENFPFIDSKGRNWAFAEEFKGNLE